MANAMLDDDFQPSQSLEDLHSKIMPISPKKTVEFALEPPPKRVRTSAKELIDAIATAITPDERRHALLRARDEWDHGNARQHDVELLAGADAVLLKHWTLVVWTNEVVDDELLWTCQALESVYRASSGAVEASFKRMGHLVLKHVVHLIGEELNRRVPTLVSDGKQEERDGPHEEEGEEGDDAARIQESPERDLLLKKLVRILGNLARVGDATKPMAHFPGLVGCLIRMISSYVDEECIPWEARLSALWVLANLACNSENMQHMACTKGMIPALVQVACRRLNTDDSLERTMEILRSRSIACRAILNLSWAPENKISLAEHAPLIDMLTELAVFRKTLLGRSRTVQDVVIQTRRYAVGALRNLAAAPRRIKIGLCEYQNGHLLDTLTDAALNDGDENVIVRAFAAIHNLAVQDTAEKMIQHPALVLALKGALSDDLVVKDDDEGSPRSHASATLMVLERSITPDMACYQDLRELLDAANPERPNQDISEESDMEGVNTFAV